MIISGIKITVNGGGTSSSTPNDGIIRTKAKQLYTVYHCTIQNNGDTILMLNEGPHIGEISLNGRRCNSNYEIDDDNGQLIYIWQGNNGDSNGGWGGIGLYVEQDSNGVQKFQFWGGRVLILANIPQGYCDICIANGFNASVNERRVSVSTTTTGVEMEYEKLELDPNAKFYSINALDYTDEMAEMLWLNSGKVHLHDGFNQFIQDKKIGLDSEVTWRRIHEWSGLNYSELKIRKGDKFIYFNGEKSYNSNSQYTYIKSNWTIDLSTLAYENGNPNYYDPYDLGILRNMNDSEDGLWSKYDCRLGGTTIKVKNTDGNSKWTHSIYTYFNGDTHNHTFKNILINPFDETKVIMEYWTCVDGTITNNGIKLIDNPLYFPIQ